MNLSYKVVVFAAAIFIPLAVNAKDREEELQDIATYRGYVDLMQSYYNVVITTRDISDNAELAAVFQMQKIGDFYRESGEAAKAIEVYQSVLEKHKNPTIRNAAYHLLSERYRELGKHKEGIEILKRGLEENLQLAE